MRTRT